jgi:hypothetical protein
MKKIVKYVIIETHSARDLRVEVNEAIKNGWQPLGGVSVSTDGSYTAYIQAMVKYDGWDL